MTGALAFDPELLKTEALSRAAQAEGLKVDPALRSTQDPELAEGSRAPLTSLERRGLARPNGSRSLHKKR